MPKIIKIDSGQMENIMGRLDFFENFSRIDLKKIILSDCQFLCYEKGEEIIAKGSIDDDFFIVLSGIVYITSDKQVMAKIEAGNFFGEISFLTKEPRTANAVAGEQALVLRIDDDIMERLHYQIKEKIKDKFIEKLITNLKRMNELLDAKLE